MSTPVPERPMLQSRARTASGSKPGEERSLNALSDNLDASDALLARAGVRPQEATRYVRVEGERGRCARPNGRYGHGP